MGKRKGKASLVAEPWAGPAYLQAEAAQEQRLGQLGGELEAEPEPEPDGTDEGSGAATSSVGERELPLRVKPELPWAEVDAYLEAGATKGGKAQRQLLVSSQPGAEYAHLDSRVAAVAALATLEVTGTPLCTLPASALGALADLQELRLPNNALLELPASVFGAGVGLPQLQVVDLSSNRLQNLPSSIVRLPKLQVLNVAANELRSLPEVGCLVMLKSLNLTHVRPQPLRPTS
jgi:Leucine-rich repeat (LRR) protein